jgi:hypothetical protein
MHRRLVYLGVLLALSAVAAGPPDAGRSYQVPYHLTNTNHFLVRVRINGKGPFNFLVDTGAPALYVATETARKVGLEPARDDFWTPVERLDFEGGASLRGVKARIEDPFQLVGMNALGLPGASIDGILGFTILARFRLEIDPTKDRMTWTRLDYEPGDPPVPRRGPGDRPPPEMQAMNALGPLAKFAAALIGKQPEDELLRRGFFGIELAEGNGEVKIAGILPSSPSAQAGIRTGDRLVRVGDHDVATLKSAYAAVAGVRPGDRVPLSLRRDRELLTITITAGEGL